MQEQIIKGVYKSSKHRVRGNQAAENYYYMGKRGQGLWFDEVQCQASVQLWVQWRGTDAWMSQVLVLAEKSLWVGMDAQVP